MSVPPITIRVACGAILFSAITHAEAAIYAVGPGPGCTHATIQAAINAAEANSGDDIIRVPHSQTWTNQALVITTAQSLSLEGYWSDCNSIDTSGTKTTLDGAGGSAAPVLRIEGNGHDINLDMFTIRNGDVAGTGGKGGGIWYRGNGRLVIANTAIINNTADLGGGMYLEGTGSAAIVQILGNVAVNGNTARDSGGGVFAEGLRFHMLHPNSIIAFNEAIGSTFGGGYGGGLVVNPKSGLDGSAFIASAGVGGAGAVYANTARYGGGISVLGESDIDAGAYLNLYTVDPSQPVAIRDNFASVAGGGLHLQPRKDYFTFGSNANASLWNAMVELNSAPDGAAIYLGESTDSINTTVGGELYWNHSRPSDAAPCPTNAPCGSLSDNVAADANGVVTHGAVVRMREDATLDVAGSAGVKGPGVLISGNRGGRLFDMEGGEDRVHLLLRNSLIVGNTLSQELLRAQDESEVSLIDSTIAGNNIGAAHVLAVSDELVVQRSIIWQPGKVSHAGPTPSIEWTIASEAESLGGGPGAIVADPRFVDAARNDYRLRAASPAIDYAPPVIGDDRDVHGLPRDQDMPVVPSPVLERVRDVGAFERQSLQPFVLNGDFVADTNLWFLPIGHAGNYQTVNAPGSSSGSGSAQVAGNSTAGRLLGYAQCIHLPGPGTWALNGSARSESAQLSNPTALIWELRLDGGEGCLDGPIAAGGTHWLGTPSTGDQWVRPGSSALMSVNEAAWNHNTSLTVIMAVYPYAGGNAYNGLFDRISLEWIGVADDVIFRNGFDGNY